MRNFFEKSSFFRSARIFAIGAVCALAGLAPTSLSAQDTESANPWSFEKTAYKLDGTPWSGPASVGDTVKYVLSYTGDGVDFSGPVKIVDTLSPSQTYVAPTTAAPGWTWGATPYSSGNMETYVNPQIGPRNYVSLTVSGLAAPVPVAGDGTAPVDGDSKIFSTPPIDTLFCNGAPDPEKFAWDRVSIVTGGAAGTLTFTKGNGSPVTLAITSNSTDYPMPAAIGTGSETLTIAFTPAAGSAESIDIKIGYAADKNPEICYQAEVTTCGPVTNTAVMGSASASGAGETSVSKMVDLGEAQGENCEAPPPPPTQASCFSGDPTIACGSEPGTFVVTIDPLGAGGELPAYVEVESLTTGVTLSSSTHVVPVRNGQAQFTLVGANPGDTIKLMVSGSTFDLSSETGMSICCNGEIEITIPEDIECDHNGYDLAVAKTGATSPAPEAPYYSFEITVSNLGDEVDDAGSIQVSDIVPDGMVFDTATGTDWTCDSLPANAGDSVDCTYTGAGPVGSGQVLPPISIAATATGDGPFGAFENCAVVGAEETANLHDAHAFNNQSCVTVDKPENDDPTDEVATDIPAYTVEKTCGDSATGLQCTIVVTTNGVPFSGALTINDTLNIDDTSGMSIVGPDGTACDDASMSCTITHNTISGYSPPNTATFTVDMPASDQEGLMNCASGSHSTMEPQSDCVLIGGEFDEPNPAPEVAGTCETDFIFVVDKSGSLNEDANGNYSPQRASKVSVAVRNMAKIAVGNGSQASLIEFDSGATVPTAMSTASLDAIANSYWMSAGGGTNWEAALIAADSILPNGGRDTIMYFITDGRPTAYVDGSGNNVNLPDNAASWLSATNEAIPVVNSIYAKGVKIIGVGASDANGMVVSTYLDALLGGNTQGSSFSNLQSDLAQSIGDMCPNIYLNKYIGGVDTRTVAFSSSDPATKRIAVMLKIQNPTSSPMTSVVVEDLIPADLTNPGNAVVNVGTATFTGQNFSWTIPSLAAGATENAIFRVDIAKPTEDVCTTERYGTNYAQVTAVDGTLQSTPNNMDPAAGPAAEGDESSAKYCAYLQDYISPECSVNSLLVDKYPTFGEACVQGSDCEFEIKVRQSCPALGYDGPVFFGDQLSTSGGDVIAPTVTSITNDVSPAVCAYPSQWATTAEGRTCTDNLVLAANATATFTVSMTAPPPGTSYENCFVSDGKSPTPTGFGSAVSPTATARGIYGSWGDCTTFEVTSNKSLVVDLPPEPSPKPELVLEKTTSGACRVDRDGQIYECPFDIEIANTGEQTFSGPIVMTDEFGKGGIRPGKLLGEDWDLTPAPKGIVGLNDNLRLAPGQSSTIVSTVIVRGIRNGGTFDNCAILGLGDGEGQQLAFAQDIMNKRGIDVGKVDGEIGPKTRRGLAKLREQLDLPPSESLGEVFEALGLSAQTQGAASCASVQLPKMPAPALKCDARTTVGNGESCKCKFSHSAKVSPTQCGCVKGYKLNGKKGCVKVRVSKPKPDQAAPKPKPDQVAPKPKSCPPGSLRVPGAGCVSVSIGRPQKPDRDDHVGGAAADTKRCRIMLNGICVK
ncbi:von Willebrand factor type A domain [Hoeflea sp. IMCC20628]|uniref:VWA domain-containing protein n=1 Tax=Hoeflea sp. IMCC20628 TaxID=1620421 RepID=UPI00063AF117|nr:VWA domain-containing protein [Hoeflea sp. IMCC20628]AKI01617.1 von Willebrand factor type A domain [Hoeflea sp. IMCC20628]